MKVLAGRLTDDDRKILFESNRTGRRVLVAATTGQWVGSVVTYDHDTVTLGGWSFTTRLDWIDCVKAWWREDAPSKEDVDALIAEHTDAKSREESA